MYVKKNLVLKSTDNSEKRAILTIENDGFETMGKLRLYNFHEEPLGIMSLGIYIGGKVEKAGLTKSDNMQYSFACNLKNVPDIFSCAVVHFMNGESQPILYGNNQGVAAESVFDSVVTALRDANTIKAVENVLDDYKIEYDDSLKREIDEDINRCMMDCEHCQYKKYFFENKLYKNLSIESQTNVEDKEEYPKRFYFEIKGQLDDLFENNPTESYLQSLIPNSKWVKVKSDDEGNFYVLGLIYENEDLKYICYGLPGFFQECPPRQLSGYPVWFALDENNPQSFGYWLSYQDAITGESVKAVIV